jgi:hypothetical protein
MNIFILDKNPTDAAHMHCDKHIVKMIVESAQMLSTVHRMCDGILEKRSSKSGKRIVKYWKHANPIFENTLYKAVHMNHPCTVWTRESLGNYLWHYDLFKALSEEFVYRYGKQHATWVKLKDVLSHSPKNISEILELTPFKLAMGAQPQCININDPIDSYRKFYITKQNRFKMTWTKREIPYWFKFA